MSVAISSVQHTPAAKKPIKNGSNAAVPVAWAAMTLPPTAANHRIADGELNASIDAARVNVMHRPNAAGIRALCDRQLPRTPRFAQHLQREPREDGAAADPQRDAHVAMRDQQQ